MKKNRFLLFPQSGKLFFTIDISAKPTLDEEKWRVSALNLISEATLPNFGQFYFMTISYPLPPLLLLDLIFTIGYHFD